MPLIVIDGVDGTGKTTQSELMVDYFKLRGLPVKYLDFPRYDRGSSVLVRQYLAGRFGDDPMSLDPYLISPMYSIDRVISYLTDWKEASERNDWLISNRYTTSNMIHQGAKLPSEEQPKFFNWLSELEYDEFGLPRPDVIFLLDLPVEVSLKLRLERGNSDIHEDDLGYLEICRETALTAAERYGWTVIDCHDGHGWIMDQEMIKAKLIAKLIGYRDLLAFRSTSL